MLDFIEYVKYKIKQLKLDYKVWLLKKAFENNPSLQKEFVAEKYHEILMSKVMDHLSDRPKYDPEKDEEYSWLVGIIPDDWERRIDDKIAEKNQKANEE